MYIWRQIHAITVVHVACLAFGTLHNLPAVFRQSACAVKKDSLSEHYFWYSFQTVIDGNKDGAYLHVGSHTQPALNKK